MTETQTDPASGLSPRAELLAKLALAIIPTFLILGLLEGGAYLWERGQANSEYAWELVASRRIDLITHPGPAGDYTLMEPGASYRWGGIPVEINSHGLRSAEVPFEKPSDTYRVLNLGDSIAMGWGVGYEDTYGYLLDQDWNNSRQDGLDYQVINAGVPGWNLENYDAYLASEGWQYEPDLVLLEITIVNDIYGPNALQQQNSRPPVIEWLRDKTHLWPFLTVQMRWIEARSQGKDRIAVIDPPTRASSYYPLDSAHPRWDEIWAYVRSIKQRADEMDADFLLVLFPLEFQVIDESFSTLPQEILTSRALEEGMQVLDLLSVYQEACDQKPGGSCQLEDRYLFADVWMHPSAFGHALAAREIDKAMEGTMAGR